MIFPFNHLSNELALEIIRLAAAPDWAESHRPYATARALCLVSHAVRRATVPHFLHTVSLTESTHLTSLVNALTLQRQHRQSRSPLALDYTRLVRRFWCNEAWEPLANSAPPEEELIDYTVLYELIRNVQSLGLGVFTLHLVYNGFAACGDPAVDWNCTHITLSDGFRWRPLTSTPEGIALLSKITHLVLWAHSAEAPPGERLIPSWFANVPLEMMPSLTHLAFPLDGGPHADGVLKMLVYTSPYPSKQNGSEFRAWALGHEPLTFGTVVSSSVRRSPSMYELDWQGAYLQGQSDFIWARAAEVARVC